MDPATASALGSILSRIADGSLGEAGAGLWRSLVSLVKNKLGRELPVLASTSRPQLDAGDVVELTEFLLDQADHHPALRTALDAWIQQANAEISVAQTTNTVVGGVSGSGKVVQAGHIDTVRFD
jgi:hypothetical protein